MKMKMPLLKEPYKINFSGEKFLPVAEVDVSNNIAALRWCEEHCTKRYSYIRFLHLAPTDGPNVARLFRFYFEDPDDALLFKLMWG